MKKKMFAVLLAVVMVMAMIPVTALTALAAEDSYTVTAEPIITDMYVPVGTPGYDPVNKIFVVSPNHPLRFVYEGENLTAIPDAWSIVVGQGTDPEDLLSGPLNPYATSITDTHVEICVDMSMLYAFLEDYVNGVYVGYTTAIYDYSTYVPSDVRMYYSYVEVESVEGVDIQLPYGLDPGEVAEPVVTPEPGYENWTLEVTDIVNGLDVPLEDGKFTVPVGGAIVTAVERTVSAYAAEVNGQGFETLEAAIAHAQTVEGSTVTLLNHVSMDDYIEVTSGKFTLNLNGYTWTSSSLVFSVGGTADVKITDTIGGALKGVGGGYPTIQLFDTAKLEIAGGTVEHANQSDAISMWNGGLTTSSELTVSGGTVKTNGQFAISAFGSSVTVTGGSFESIAQDICYKTGIIDLSGHPDPAGITIGNFTDTVVTVSDSTINLPAEYVMLDKNGEAQTTLAAYAIYTVAAVSPTYTVTVDSTIANGTVIASPTDAAQGETVTLVLTPDEDFEVGTITVTGENGDPVAVDENNSFIMPEGNVTVTVTFVPGVHFHEKEGYEIIWSETFDGDTVPEGFTAVDVDEDGYNWFCESGEKINHECKEGYGCVSASYINSIGILDTHHLLKLPAFDLDPEEEYFLSFMVRAVDASYPDDYNVHISLDGGETYVWSRGVEAAPLDWTEVMIDLTPYAGKTVTVVIEHEDYDQYYITFDCMYLYKKITLESMAGELQELDAAIEDLRERIENKADADEIAQKLEEINATIAALEQSGATDAELEKAKTDLTAAYTKALEDATADLEEKIAAQVDPAELDHAVAGLEALIDAAEAYADTQDAALRQELENEISGANALIASLDTRVTEAEQAIEAVEQAIEALKAADTADAQALSDAIATLNQAIADAQTAAADADAANKAALEQTLAEAETVLNDKIDDVKADLEQAITDLQTATGKELADAVADLTNLINTTKAALEATDTANKAELEQMIEDADKALDEAIRTVQTNLDNAKAELDEAIASLDAAMKQGDADLSHEIANLNAALTNAKAALEQADAESKAELISKIETADATLDAAIKAVQKNLDDAKNELQNAIQANETDIEDKVTKLNAALESAKAALAATDAANKTELEGKIADARTTLQAAIDKVASDLTQAKTELQNAIESGDKTLDGKIAALNTALDNAISAYQAADGSLKSELTTKIEDADATLDAAIKAVQKNLDDAKNELQNAIQANETDIEDKVTKLNAALESAKAALAATDAANKTELEGKIADARTTLQAAIDKVASDLTQAKTELQNAIESGDKTLDGKIAALNTALDNAISAYQAADGSLKSELTTKIEDADATLDAAIKAVQKNLDDAKAELDKAIMDGDTELGGEIAALNDALASAEAALEATDVANKNELTAKIDEADAVLKAAMDALSGELSSVKQALENKDAELEAKDSELQIFVIIACGVSGAALCGSGAFVIWFFIDRKKRI